MPTIEVMRQRPPRLAHCAGCSARVEWVTTLAKGKAMPVEHPLLVEREHERLDGSVVTVIDGGQSHFANCPEAKLFRKGR